jgi:hypothetical protein
MDPFPPPRRRASSAGSFAGPHPGGRPWRSGVSRRLLALARAALAGLGVTVAGCHDSKPPETPPPRRAPAVPPGGDGAVSRDTLPGEFRKVELRAVPAVVALPDPASWRAAREGSFVVLAQRATNSRIVLRVWKAARLVRPAECEAEARLHRPTLPKTDPTTLLDERSISAPRDYDVRLFVGVHEAAQRRVHGYALAVGAAVGRCYLGVYETWADGPAAPERVADRLATMVPGFIETLSIESAEVPVHRTPE